ncbi:hypothetical protein IU470_08265 [Nocardia abscessus]|uniref:Uncharacterized protein n=1 Tax=Nocardia abscessus TaxID=120957 RepID=A0ABS0C5U2_9NOCA|nr:hypothetical protein [Nocardia abscessus]MBF6225101.1 hypothetical protein [Nocardia abscessus]
MLARIKELAPLIRKNTENNNGNTVTSMLDMAHTLPGIEIGGAMIPDGRLMLHDGSVLSMNESLIGHVFGNALIEGTAFTGRRGLS